MKQTQNASLEYRELRQSCTSVQLATLNHENRPEASYAPCVWYQGDCFLFLSGLSSHSGNLLRNPGISLLLLEQASPANAFARKRASLHGNAQVIDRGDELFASVMQLFHESFGKIMQMLEPLPDFRLFRVTLVGGSFVRGFGQAYRLEGKGLERLAPIDPASQA